MAGIQVFPPSLSLNRILNFLFRQSYLPLPQLQIVGVLCQDLRFNDLESLLLCLSSEISSRETVSQPLLWATQCLHWQVLLLPPLLAGEDQGVPYAATF